LKNDENVPSKSKINEKSRIQIRIFNSVVEIKIVDVPVSNDMTSQAFSGLTFVHGKN
jgi:hypothetical protein